MATSKKRKQDNPVRNKGADVLQDLNSEVQDRREIRITPEMLERIKSKEFKEKAEIRMGLGPLAARLQWGALYALNDATRRLEEELTKTSKELNWDRFPDELVYISASKWLYSTYTVGDNTKRKNEHLHRGRRETFPDPRRICFYPGSGFTLKPESRSKTTGASFFPTIAASVLPTAVTLPDEQPYQSSHNNDSVANSFCDLAMQMVVPRKGAAEKFLPPWELGEQSELQRWEALEMSDAGQRFVTTLNEMAGGKTPWFLAYSARGSVLLHEGDVLSFCIEPKHMHRPAIGASHTEKTSVYWQEWFLDRCCSEYCVDRRALRRALETYIRLFEKLVPEERINNIRVCVDNHIAVSTAIVAHLTATYKSAEKSGGWIARRDVVYQSLCENEANLCEEMHKFVAREVLPALARFDSTIKVVFMPMCWCFFNALRPGNKRKDLTWEGNFPPDAEVSHKAGNKEQAARLKIKAVYKNPDSGTFHSGVYVLHPEKFLSLHSYYELDKKDSHNPKYVKIGGDVTSEELAKWQDPKTLENIVAQFENDKYEDEEEGESHSSSDEEDEGAEEEDEGEDEPSKKNSPQEEGSSSSEESSSESSEREGKRRKPDNDLAPPSPEDEEINVVDDDK